MPKVRNVSDRGLRGARIDGVRGPLIAPGQMLDVDDQGVRSLAADIDAGRVEIVPEELSPRKAAEQASAKLKVAAKPKAKSKTPPETGTAD